MLSYGQPIQKRSSDPRFKIDFVRPLEKECKRKKKMQV